MDPNKKIYKTPGISKNSQKFKNNEVEEDVKPQKGNVKKEFHDEKERPNDDDLEPKKKKVVRKIKKSDEIFADKTQTGTNPTEYTFETIVDTKTKVTNDAMSYQSPMKYKTSSDEIEVNNIDELNDK